MDDASTDETLNIIKRYSGTDPRIQIITNTKNKKLPSSLNIGHKACRGEYITWTSDDNNYHADAIYEMVNILNDNPFVGMAYCDFVLIDVDGHITRRISVKSYETLSNYNCIGACFLYRRSVYKKIGLYNSQTRFAEDYDYWLRVASNFQVMPIHKELYYYRIHENSLTSQTRSHQIALAKEIAIMRNLAGLNWLSRREKVEKAVYFARRAYYRKDYRSLVMHIFSAFRLSPTLAADWFHAAFMRKFVE